MRAVFLDRDGVICENRKDHVKNWDEFEFLPGIFDALRTLRSLGLPVFVVTNQAIINRGITPVNVLDDIHNRMKRIIEVQGGYISGVYYCPHRPDENCRCRKPGAGMLLQAAREHNIDLSESYMIGDAETDIAAGQAVGCTSIMVLTGRGMEQLTQCRQNNRKPDLTVFNLDAAIKEIVSMEGRRLTPTLRQQPQLSPVPQMLFAASPVLG